MGAGRWVRFVVAREGANARSGREGWVRFIELGIAPPQKETEDTERMGSFRKLG